MKKKMALWLALILTPVLAAETGKILKVSVNGMVCAFCVQGIERGVEKLSGVKAVKVDLNSHLVSVEIKPGEKVNQELIKKAIVDAGFNVTKIEE